MFFKDSEECLAGFLVLWDCNLQYCNSARSEKMIV